VTRLSDERLAGADRPLNTVGSLDEPSGRERTKPMCRSAVASDDCFAWADHRQPGW
jgi:hypothetical protein